MVSNNTALYIIYSYEFQYLGSLHYFLILSDQIKLDGIVSNYLCNIEYHGAVSLPGRVSPVLLVVTAIWNHGFPQQIPELRVFPHQVAGYYLGSPDTRHREYAGTIGQKQA